VEFLVVTAHGRPRNGSRNGGAVTERVPTEVGHWEVRMTLRRLIGPGLTALAVALAACDHATSPRVWLEIREFVASEPIDAPQRTEAVYADPERGIVLFTVPNGPPQDCPSGCFFDTAVGLSAEGRVGWIDPPRGAGPWTLFDVRATDASLFDPSTWSRIKERLPRADAWIFVRLADFVACDPDTPSATRDYLTAAVGRPTPAYCFPP
jgi:hypothetical protein